MYLWKGENQLIHTGTWVSRAFDRVHTKLVALERDCAIAIELQSAVQSTLSGEVA